MAKWEVVTDDAEIARAEREEEQNRRMTQDDLKELDGIESEEDQEEEEIEEEEQEEENEEIEESEEEDESEEEIDDVDSEDETEENEDDEESEDSEETETEETDNQEILDISDLTDGVFSTESELKDFAAAMKDPYLKGMIEYYRAEGTIAPYYESQKYDYDKVSDHDILKMKLQQSYEGFDLESEDLNLLFEEEILAKYKQDDPDQYEEREVRIGKVKMAKEAKEYRDQLKAQQQKFAQPETKRETREEKQAREEQEKRDRLNLEKKFRGDLSKRLKDGRISIKSGDVDISFKTSDKRLVDLSMDSGKILEKLVDDKGNIEWWKLAILDNPEEFIAAAQNAGATTGTKKLIDKELKNKKKSKGSSTKSTKTFSENPSRKELYSLDWLKNSKVVSS